VFDFMNDKTEHPGFVSRVTHGTKHAWRQWVVPHRKGWAWGVGIMVAIVVLLRLLHPAPQQQQGRNGRFGGDGPTPVATATAAKGDIPVTLNALGTITPLATVTVHSQIAGILTEVKFQEGQLLHEGDVLAIVDPRPYQHALDQAQGQLERDQALLTNAELDAARYKTLFEQDSIAKQQLDTQVALVRQDRGVVQTDKAAVDTAKLNLSYCTIRAPLTGRVGLRQVDPGNYVGVGDVSSIAVITQMKPITAIFTIAEDNLPSVLQHLRQNQTLSVTATDRRQKVKLATGVVTTIDNQIDTTTGMVKLRAQFANDDEMLFPNQFVNIELLVDTVRDATVVPVAAIQRGAPGTFVYLVGNDSKVTVRPVKLGPEAGERVAIESGLAPGDVVVVDGADRLKEGARVNATPVGQAGKPGAPPPNANGADNGANAKSGEEGHRRGQGRHRRQGNGDAGGGSSGGPH
jgi:multidrug efflux system membrane fusion protein